MNTLFRPASFLLPLLLAACASNAPPQTQTHTAPATETEQEKTATAYSAIPYPQLDTQEQIDRLGIQISRLEQHIEVLNTRIQQLERQQPPHRAAPVRSVSPRNLPQAQPPAAASQFIPNRIPAPAAFSALDQAKTQFRNGNYKAVLNTLRGAEGGGEGSDTDRQSMYLLMQSHMRLGNCESAINIGNRLVSRFRGSSEAPEAMFGVAQCQYRMQQKDIARDTWRKLIQTYPESSAAKRAVAQLKK